jgi:hypothetical protein
MYCSNCGARLPDDAAFCFKCGQSQGTRVADPGRWEYCEIFVRYKDGVLRDTYYFEAEAVGPRGPYIAMRSREWREPANEPRWQATDNSNETAFAIHKELISALIKDGWEVTGEKGSNWENHRFRRAVRR